MIPAIPPPTTIKLLEGEAFSSQIASGATPYIHISDTAIVEYIDNLNNKSSLVFHQDLHQNKLTGYSYIWLLPIYSLLSFILNDHKPYP